MFRIRELGPMPRARLLGAAAAADRDCRGVALLTGEGWGGTFFAMDPIEEVRVPFGPDALEEVSRALDARAVHHVRGWNGGRPAPRTLGYVAYEAARSIERESWRAPDTRAVPAGAAMVLRHYAAVALRDARGIVAIEGETDSAIDALATLLAGQHSIEHASVDLTATDDDDAHRARVARAIELIADGDLYVVNLARTFVGRTDATATAILATLLARASAPFAAALDFGDHALACSSPELFLDIDGGTVRTTPIKGTRPRGLDAETDVTLAQELDADPKERAELTMIIDLERNDLGRIAEIGSVRVPHAPRVETTRTVHHRACDVVARSVRSRGEIFTAMFPSGSVTGAPKVRAMEVISELEAERRGIYCGALVAMAPDGHLRAAMAIRTVVVERGRATYHAGGGIVAGSDPGREVSETLWKARQVMATPRRI